MDYFEEALTETTAQIYSVSEINQATRALLEAHFASVWVEGEISNIARPGSGHWYFTLKDHKAQIRCAMFRMRASRVTFAVEEGSQVRVRAQVSLYEGRGDFQLIVESMEEVGDGALQRAFEALKKRLQAEGLFEEARKQALPELPRCIGVITSPTGAAIRDILTVCRRRFPLIPLVIYPTSVQGAQAAGEIVHALELANRDKRCDLLIMARGGGSLEDLWAFNEEIVARAIGASAIPVISGVGHQVDFTIADFVADQRAATPSAAAELACPDQADWYARFAYYHERLEMIVLRDLRELQHRVTLLRKSLRDPLQRLHQQSQRLDHLSLRLQQAVKTQWRDRQQAFARVSTQLQAYSPQATLDRGYAIVMREEDRSILRGTAGLDVGDRVVTRLADGVFGGVVDVVE